METFSEFMQKMVNYSYDELLHIARNAYNKLIPDLVAFFGDGMKGVSTIFLALTAACLGVDGEFTKLEWRFVNDLSNAVSSYDSWHNAVSQMSGRQAEELIDSLADSLEQDARNNLLTLALCFLAVDETITAKESAFIRKLLE